MSVIEWGSWHVWKWKVGFTDLAYNINSFENKTMTVNYDGTCF